MLKLLHYRLLYIDCSLTGRFTLISEVIYVLINEIAIKCNTTKKSVQYYVAEGLIVPKILGNGYQDFSEEDMRVLKQIVLYRKLGLSIAEIKSVLNNPNELISAIHQRTLVSVIRRDAHSRDLADHTLVHRLTRRICYGLT